MLNTKEIISVAQIVGQYRMVVGVLNNMFKVMGQRSEIELWRVDGVGSCRNMDREASEYHLGGPAINELIRLREERNREVSGKASPLTDCPYHREGLGCVLGDRKGPYCVSHIDRPSTLNKQFGINGYELMQDIDQILRAVLRMDGTFVKANYPNSIDFSQLTEDAIEAVSKMTRYVDTFPVLRMEDRPFLNWMISHDSKGGRASRLYQPNN